MSLHRIAVISDTHGMLRQEVLDRLHGAERILHGGDITDRRVTDRLSRISEVIAVRGNCDREDGMDLPKERCFGLYGKKVYMIHNRKEMTQKAEDADIIIFGHSHKYEEAYADGKLWLNPGSCGPRRFHKLLTMAMLMIDDETGNIEAEKIDLKIDLSAGEIKTGQSDSRRQELKNGNMKSIAETVVKDLKRGRSVDEIVKKRGFSRSLTEEICQIYFTHPGIDVQGVTDRLEIAGL